MDFSKCADLFFKEPKHVDLTIIVMKVRKKTQLLSWKKGLGLMVHMTDPVE
jgi:hypothetical protein